MIKLKDINIDYNHNTMNSDEVELLKVERDLSILSHEEFCKKLYKGEVKSVNPKHDEENPVFVYVMPVEEGKARPVYGVQFYDIAGNLLFTFPWNGSVEEKVNNKRKLYYPNDMFGRKQKLEELALTSTPEGTVLLKEKDYVLQAPLVPGSVWNYGIYSKANDYRTTQIGGLVDYSNYGKELPKNLKPGSNAWFKVASEEGDRFLKYSSENSYVY